MVEYKTGTFCDWIVKIKCWVVNHSLVQHITQLFKSVWFTCKQWTIPCKTHHCIVQILVHSLCVELWAISSTIHHRIVQILVYGLCVELWTISCKLHHWIVQIFVNTSFNVELWTIPVNCSNLFISFSVEL